MTYDFQDGQWIVSETTFRVAHPDSEGIHLQILRAG
jgi:hypothetical protein